MRDSPKVCSSYRKVDTRLPGTGNSNSHGARPVHQIISMIKWIRTSRLSIKKTLSQLEDSLAVAPREAALEGGSDQSDRLRPALPGGEQQAPQTPRNLKPQTAATRATMAACATLPRSPHGLPTVSPRSPHGLSTQGNCFTHLPRVSE